MLVVSGVYVISVRTTPNRLHGTVVQVVAIDYDSFQQRSKIKSNKFQLCIKIYTKLGIRV